MNPSNGHTKSPWEELAHKQALDIALLEKRNAVLFLENGRMRKALEIIREGSGGWPYQLSHAALSGKDVI